MAVLSTVLHGQFAGQEINHQRYYEVSALPANYNGFVAAFRTALAAVVATAVFPDTLSYTHFVIRPVETGSIGSIVPFSSAVTGTAAVDTLPPFVTVRIGLYASATQHPVRGMVQYSGIPESMQDAGVLTSSAQEVYEDLANVFSIDIDAGGADMWNPVLWSQTYERSAPITAYQVKLDLGTQRRRMTGSGS